MQTDWNLIRDMMNAAIDACERIEAAGFTEADRSATTGDPGLPVSVHDFLVSGWVYPERVRYQIIHARHEEGADLPYVPETARILTAMAQASAELIGAKSAAPAEEEIRQMVQWYGAHAAPGIERAIANRRASESS